MLYSVLMRFCDVLLALVQYRVPGLRPVLFGQLSSYEVGWGSVAVLVWLFFCHFMVWRSEAVFSVMFSVPARLSQPPRALPFL
jgi:hypothetical protein